MEADPMNLDAHLLYASLNPPGKRYTIFETAMKMGRTGLIRMFGPETFDDSGGYVGHFWGILQTRPVRCLVARHYSRWIYGVLIPSCRFIVTLVYEVRISFVTLSCFT